MRKFWFGAVALFSFTFATAQSVKTVPQIESAKNKIVNEDYAGARKDLTTFIGATQDADEKAQATYWLGEAGYKEKVEEQKVEAIKAFSDAAAQAVLVAKANPFTLAAQGKMQLLTKKPAEALKSFEQAIGKSKQKPYKEGHPEIAILIGNAYMDVENYELATAWFGRARDYEPKSAKAWLSLGDANVGKGDAGAAMSAYESAAQKDAKDAEVYLKMARIWARASKYDLAIQNAEKGLEVNQTYAPIYKELVEWYMTTKQYNKVLPSLQKYIDLSRTAGETPDPASRYRLIKFLTYQAKEYDRAVVEAEALLKDVPSYKQVYRWIAWAKCSKADSLQAAEKDAKVITPASKALYEGALEAAKTLISLTPADSLVEYDYEYAAKSSLKLGNIADAEKYYRLVVSKDAERACGTAGKGGKISIYPDLIQAYYAQKMYKEGFALLDEQLEKCGTKGNDRTIYYAMYYAYSAKMYEQAIKYADKYIEINGTIVDGYHYKAMSQIELDDDNNPQYLARETYDKMIAAYEAKSDERSKTMVDRAYAYVGLHEGDKLQKTGATDFSAACAWFKKALAVNPNNKTASAMIGQLQCP